MCHRISEKRRKSSSFARFLPSSVHAFSRARHQCIQTPMPASESVPVQSVPRARPAPG